MPFKSFLCLLALVSLSWWWLAWMSQCQFVCACVSPCVRTHSHACKSACSCFDHITLPFKLISVILHKLLLPRVPAAQAVTVHGLVGLFWWGFFSVTVTNNKCAFCCRNYNGIGKASRTLCHCDRSICILNEVHRHSQRPSHFTGGIFGLLPSPGGTSCESHTVV